MQIRISSDYSASIDFIGGGMIRWYDGGTGRYIDFDRQQSAIMLRTMRHVEERKNAAHFAVIDLQTREQVGKPYSDKSRARRRRDRLDVKYGACRYSIVELMADGSRRFISNERFEPGKCLISGVETVGVFDNDTNRFAPFREWETAAETARDLNNNAPTLGNPGVYIWRSIPN